MSGRFGNGFVTAYIGDLNIMVGLNTSINQLCCMQEVVSDWILFLIGALE